jgi:lysophospholipase L1-like esterase
MRLVRLAAGFILTFAAFFHAAQAQLRCGPFTASPPAAPEPRTNPYILRRMDAINLAVKTEPHRVLYLGDSITQYWDPQVWAENLASRGVLNAGVAGDRTEHLRWRLDHGNLDGPPPRGIILLIGTNDLGHGRSPSEAAEGIRATLIELRERLPTARILLLGLWPRDAKPTDRLRREVTAVNQQISRCADGQMIVYADIGGVLLDQHGWLVHDISPDLLHFSAKGYALVAPRLDPLIDRMIGAP